jgi:hypothetical protein
MIPKSGYRFSEKIMLNKEVERDDDNQKSSRASGFRAGGSMVRLAGRARGD